MAKFLKWSARVAWMLLAAGIVGILCATPRFVVRMDIREVEERLAIPEESRPSEMESFELRVDFEPVTVWDSQLQLREQTLHPDLFVSVETPWDEILGCGAVLAAIAFLLSVLAAFTNRSALSNPANPS